jgi:hypothetical protein
MSDDNASQDASRDAAPGVVADGALPSVLRFLGLLAGWQQVVLVVLCFAGGVLVSQLPFSYTVMVGNQRGAGSDLPFLSGFKASESQGRLERWRWSDSQFRVDVPGVGQRGVVVTMKVISHRAQWEAAQNPDAPYQPAVLSVDASEGVQVPLSLRLHRAVYHVYLPPRALSDGSLNLHMATEAWENPDDRREDLGVALAGMFRVAGVRSGGWVPPDSALLLAWSLSLALLWSTLRVVGFGGNRALLMLLPLSVAIPLLLVVQAPRLGFGNGWVVLVSLMSIAVAGLCRWTVPPLLRRLRLEPPPSLLSWLLLLVVASFVLKYGGRLYPESMPGDLQLHVNRTIQTLQGRVYIEAQHRGLPFPFPNGPYILIVPLLLAGLDLRFLLQVMLGVYEAITVVLLYVLLARATGSKQLGVLAGAVYALTAGGFMNTWFMFHTQVMAQFASILLLAVLVVRWPRYDDWLTWVVLVMLFVQVFLGHIGLFLNTSLVGLLIVPLLWWRNRGEHERRGVVWLLGAGTAAGVFAFGFYYSAFWNLIVEQLTGAMTVGLNELTERPPIPRETTLWVTWEGGLITHFGFFPVLLALPGTLLLSDGRLRRSILPPLIWLTFLVSASQAVLPLITLNSITTRWLMFSAWAIAVTSAVGFGLVWRRGRWGRVVALAMGGYVGWVTLALYVEALALRQPPIEPF